VNGCSSWLLPRQLQSPVCCHRVWALRAAGNILSSGQHVQEMLSRVRFGSWVAFRSSQAAAGSAMCIHLGCPAGPECGRGCVLECKVQYLAAGSLYRTTVTKPLQRGSLRWCVMHYVVHGSPDDPTTCMITNAALLGRTSPVANSLIAVSGGLQNPTSSCCDC
jgi:hypothetical protein